MTVWARDRFSIAEFRRRAGLHAVSPEIEAHGDHRLNPGSADGIRERAVKPAAVLFGIVDRPEGATVLLTQRTEALRSHSGQIAFPGGRIDDGDETPEHAALREAEEEIGITAASVEIVGRLPDYLTGSGYRIVPVLAVIDPAHRLRLNPHEVADAFETPLAFLMDEGNWKRGSRVWEGRERFFWTVPWEERYIWGVTAGIIRSAKEGLWE
ncbi:MAG: CoA pyrophosphatase [Phyllobacteriaceae bacterium]|nr:CoA pyrophosphatase [Phyllobacteriaceae bacterium]